MALLFLPTQPLRITHRTTGPKIKCRARSQWVRCAPISLASDDNTDANDSSAWSAWQQARSKPEDEALRAPQRDPDAETDFWRSTARELLPDALEETRASAQRAVWGDARDVTADVDKIKSQLEEELNSYDPDKALDDFRETARELTNSQLDAIDQVVGGSTPSDTSTTPTSDFLPSVAASDFSSTPDFSSNTPSETSNIDEPRPYDFDAAWGARTEVPNEAWVRRDTSNFTPSSVPPRPSGGPTYGSDSNMDPKEFEEWRRSAGFQARDPKAETDFWRDTAKELLPDTPRRIPAPIEGLESSDAVEFEESPVPSTGSFADYHEANRRWTESLGSGNAGTPAFTDGAKPWVDYNVSQDWGAGDWTQGSESSRWQAWSESNSPRQEPRQQSRGGVLGEETDMWMSFARDVTDTGSTDSETTSSSSKNAKSTSEPEPGLGDAINFWSSAAKEITETLPNDSESSAEDSQPAK